MAARRTVLYLSAATFFTQRAATQKVLFLAEQDEDGTTTEATTEAPQEDPEKNGNCNCIFQGTFLPQRWLNSLNDKTRAHQMRAYGTICAAWDNIPGMPYHDLCQGETPEPFCGLPWCFVSPDCPLASRFQGLQSFAGVEDAWFSYGACGAPDCVDPTSSRCRFDRASSAGKYEGNCRCKYRRGFNERDDIDGLYGATCASWDQVPFAPDYESRCNTAALDEYCGSRNDCQVPWCYVDEECETALATTSPLKSGLFWSDDTCFSAPTCNQNKTDHACPFDAEKANWSTRIADCNAEEECQGCITYISIGKSFIVLFVLSFCGSIGYVFLNSGDEDEEGDSDEDGSGSDDAENKS